MERYARYQNLPFPISRRPQLTRYPDKTKAYFPLKVKLPLSPVPQRGPYRERVSVARASGLFFHSHLSKLQVKKQVENKQSPSTATHVDGRPAYNGVRPGSPRRSFTALLLPPQGHAAFGTIHSIHLGLGRPVPR